MIPKVLPYYNVIVEGMTKEELLQACEEDRVLDADPRETANGIIWWIPDPPTILEPRDVVSLRAGRAPNGMEPLIVTARRAGMAPQSLTRLCRLGRVPGAYKEVGQWFVPIGARIDKPKQGRSLQLPPEWTDDERAGFLALLGK